MDNPPRVKKGDRVRVVIEGVVVPSYDDRSSGVQVFISHDGGYRSHIVKTDEPAVVSVEVLPEPIPADAIGVCDNGHAMIRMGDKWGHWSYRFGCDWRTTLMVGRRTDTP